MQPPINTREGKMKGIRFCCCSALLALLTLGQPVAAETAAPYDGKKLLDQCTQVVKTEPLDKTSEAFDAGYCLGVMQGITSISQLLFFEMEKNGVPKLFCLPKQGFSHEQMVRVVLKYLNDHPEHLHIYAIALITRALVEAFPCGK
jgi:Rap1a immunity proteins